MALDEKDWTFFGNLGEHCKTAEEALALLQLVNSCAHFFLAHGRLITFIAEISGSNASDNTSKSYSLSLFAYFGSFSSFVDHSTSKKSVQLRPFKTCSYKSAHL